MARRPYVHQRANLRLIRTMRRAGLTLREIAGIVGGHPTNHHYITTGKTWRKES